MIKFKKVIDTYDPGKYYGIIFESHPKRKGMHITIGRNIYIFWIGRDY